MKEVTAKLSEAEINHLLVHLEANDQNTGTDYDWYYGNPVQFKKRHERLKQKLERAISTLQKTD